jgi:nucleoside-diphosphate-sugar epimerase
VDGSVRLARQAAASGVRRLIFMSTVKVNGEESTPGRPFRFDDPPQPVDAYGVSKLEAENALREVGRATGLEVVCLRCPLVYGPGVRGNFERMMALVHRGVVLPFGSIDNRRSLVSIGNLADLVDACVRHPQPLDGVLMVSDGQDLSTPQLLRKVASGLGRRARLPSFPVPLLRLAAAVAGRRQEAQRLCSSLQVDISATRERVGWRPSISVDDSLRETAAAWLAANQ